MQNFQRLSVYICITRRMCRTLSLIEGLNCFVSKKQGIRVSEKANTLQGRIILKEEIFLAFQHNDLLYVRPFSKESITPSRSRLKITIRPQTTSKSMLTITRNYNFIGHQR